MDTLEEKNDWSSKDSIFSSELTKNQPEMGLFSLRKDCSGKSFPLLNRKTENVRSALNGRSLSRNPQIADGILMMAFAGHY